MSLPSLVLFDCDGVLVDSERLGHSVLREMIAEYGVNLTLEQTLEHFMGTSTEKGLEIPTSWLGQRTSVAFWFERECWPSMLRPTLHYSGLP